MQKSVSTSPDSLSTPPPSSSAVTDVRNSTTHHQNHHGTTSGSNNNGRTNTLLVGGGERGLKGSGFLPKSSSSSSPPKTQHLSNVNLNNPAPNSGNSNPTQPQTQPQPQQSLQQQQKQQQTHCSPSKTHETHKRASGDSPNHSGSGSGAGDVFLQWGLRKRSKRTVGDKFSSGHIMLLSGGGGGGGSRGGGGGGGAKLRPNSNGIFRSKDASPSLQSSINRNLEDSRMDGGGSPSSKNHNGGSRSISRSAVGKRSHSATEKTDTKKNPPSSFGGSIKKDKSTDSLVQSEQLNGSHTHHLTSPPRGGAAVVVAVAAPAETETHSKSNSESMEWPRIFLALSRKEKEEDFFTMKGTKLPHRPKKRAKAIDRALQYCFPGMWLSDLTRARYEVRERKGVKKPNRRGLKGLESMDSDSD